MPYPRFPSRCRSTPPSYAARRRVERSWASTSYKYLYEDFPNTPSRFTEED